MSNPAHSKYASERFRADDADVTFKSCDQIIFKIHRKNLETHSEGFAPPDGTSSPNEVVLLTERADVLELLFQYIYPLRQPNLKTIEFEVLSRLSEAAEKYQVYSAMEICSVRMESAYPQHPFEVLLYATKHGYPDLMDVAVRRAMELSTEEALACFPPAIYIAWVRALKPFASSQGDPDKDSALKTRYYARWLDVLKFASSYGDVEQLAHHNPHLNHGYHILKTLRRIGEGPASLVNLDFVFEPVDHNMTICANCISFRGWRPAVEEKIAALPKFSAFM